VTIAFLVTPDAVPIEGIVHGAPDYEAGLRDGT